MSKLQELEPRYEVMCRFEQVGFHAWTKAPTHRNYLKNDHRHLFKFMVRVQVEHANRAIECHDLKEICEQWSQTTLGKKAVTMSCEELADKLLCCLHTTLEPQWGRVECWEDGEVGGACEVEWARTLGD